MEYEPSRGYVYLLRNSAMPGLVKIGFTDRDPKTRAAELSSSTSLPEPFSIVAWWEIEGITARSVESRIHSHLSHVRHAHNREFFRVDPKDAQVQIQLMLGEWMREGVLRAFHERDIEQDLQRARAERKARELKEEQDRQRARAEREARELKEDQDRQRAEQQRKQSLITQWNTTESRLAMARAKESSNSLGKLSIWQNPVSWFVAALLVTLVFGSVDGAFVVLLFGAWGGIMFLAVRGWMLVSGSAAKQKNSIESHKTGAANSSYQESRRAFFAQHGVSPPPTGAVDERA